MPQSVNLQNLSMFRKSASFSINHNLCSVSTRLNSKPVEAAFFQEKKDAIRGFYTVSEVVSISEFENSFLLFKNFASSPTSKIKEKVFQQYKLSSRSAFQQRKRHQKSCIKASVIPVYLQFKISKNSLISGLSRSISTFTNTF